MGILRQSLGLETLSASASKRLARGIPSRSQTSVTLDTVVGLPAAFRAIQLITTIGAGVPFDAWRGDELVERQPQVIRKPDPWRSRRSWKMRALTSVCADGNVFLRNTPSVLNPSEVVAAPVMNPFAVTIRRDKSGRKVYDHRLDNGKTETLSAEEVTHIWLNEFPGFKRGVSPITACRLAIAGAIKMRDYADNFFDAVPPGVLSSDQPIGQTDAELYKRLWHEGEAGEVKVTGKGLNFTPTIIKPEDAQWIEGQKFTVLEHARMWAVPPYRLAAAIEGSSLTYQNLADVSADFIDSGLRPVYLDPIAAGLSELVPNGQDVRDNYTSLLRRDDKYRFETHKVAIDAGIYDADEARRREGIAGPAPAKPQQPANREDDAA